MILTAALLLSLVQAQARTPSSENIPLFRAFPSLGQVVPREAILTSVTALDPMTHLEQRLYSEAGAPPAARPALWVKRDDISENPLGGNKARKLEFLLAAAAKKGATTLITSGMYGSNHCLATAVAAHERGLKARLVLGPQPITENVKQKLLALHALGAEMRFHSNRIAMAIDFITQSILARLFPSMKLYYIPPGGSNDLGDLGYVNAFLELVEQTGVEGLPKRIVVPVGTMGTSAGLLVGSCLAGVYERVKIEGVNVADPLLTNDGATRRQATHLYNFIRKHLDDADLKKLPRCDFHSRTAFEFITEFYAPGYGATSPEVFKAMKVARESENIVLDGTYSGKAWAYFLASVRSRIAEGHGLDKTLFWLTYDSYDLNKIIDSVRWTHPEQKWLDLPKDFQRFYVGRSGD